MFCTQWIHSLNRFSFNQNVGRELLGRTLSCFVIDFVMLISTMFCVRFILSIRHYLIPLFECEWDGGGTIRILGVVINITRMRCPARTRSLGEEAGVAEGWPSATRGLSPSGRRAGRGSPAATAANAEFGQPRRVGGRRHGGGAAARWRGGGGAWRFASRI